MQIAVLIPDSTYRRMITEETDAYLDGLGAVKRARGDGKAVAAQASELLREADVLLTGWSTPAIQEAWLDQAPRLRLICHCAGSVRGMIPSAVFGRGIVLCHAAPIIADAVAEFCIGVELLWLRRVPWRSEQLKSGGSWNDAKAEALEGHLLAAQLVGLVGSGYVAQRHIRLLKAFGPRIRVADPYLTAERAAELGVEQAGLEEIFSNSDIIAVHAPKTPETRHLIDAALLASIKPGAILIQNSRSWVMDQDALLQELQTGRFVAALDVFDREPQPPDSPFYRLDNVIVTPHMAGATRESYAQQGRAMAEEVERFSRGQPLRYQIAPERFDQMA